MVSRCAIAAKIATEVLAASPDWNTIKNNDQTMVRIEHATAFKQVMIDLLANHLELFKQFGDHSAIQKSLAATLLGMTRQQSVLRRR
ncbi:hypothetical protein PCC6311_0627 [Synechococcus elongatus PCC 6311]|uniref:Uncharacterized protein n=1 Tax=Synechococcus elongatus (strain ATCC 33912 / PCC 7942 / FACHB-805) TaxID=1140 RepID=Q31QN6_SYNE7|nr:hypothetical protein Synpcc7942_0601 [Synechococcus elongatus PCC 7942 = FACHB-805]UOW70393.1 hypothetical protein PCC7943_0627 [Synechococcus elongatus PCC 7943]UOW73114.1 hypothetical protein PCC6311_0627 [Synechococcus elongatus PCC 6311]UOW75835.1 hypothetical protein PCC6301pg_0627 [Synechococcus elongatus PCC 6301]